MTADLPDMDEPPHPTKKPEPASVTHPGFFAEFQDAVRRAQVPYRRQALKLLGFGRKADG